MGEYPSLEGFSPNASMDGFRTAAGIACFIGIVIAIIDALAPSEKFTKQLKMMFALVFMLCVITPIANGSIDFTDESVYAFADSEYAETDAEALMKRAVERNISRNIIEELRQNGITAEKCETSINISDDSGIDITVINLKVSPADADKAARILSDSLREEFTLQIFETDRT